MGNEKREMDDLDRMIEANMARMTPTRLAKIAWAKANAHLFTDTMPPMPPDSAEVKAAQETVRRIMSGEPAQGGPDGKGPGD